MVEQADIALIWLTLKEGTDDFVDKTSPNVVGQRKESASVCCELLQSIEDKKKFVLFEVFTSSAGLTDHREQPHYKEWKPWIQENLGDNGRDRRQYKAHGVKGGVEAFHRDDLATGLDITLVHIACKPGTEDAFIKETLKNKAGVEANEPDAVRFDILQQVEDPTKFILFEAFKDADAVKYHKTLEHFLTWRTNVQDYMAENRRGEKVSFVPVGEKSALMKVSAKKNAGFYTKAAASFLRGTASKPPVEELVIAALGEAIEVAVAVAARLEKDGLAKMVSIRTDYPEMPSRSSQQVAPCCAHVEVTLKPVADTK